MLRKKESVKALLDEMEKELLEGEYYELMKRFKEAKQIITNKYL